MVNKKALTMGVVGGITGLMLWIALKAKGGEVPPSEPFGMAIDNIEQGPTGEGTLEGYDIYCTVGNPGGVEISHKLRLFFCWAGTLIGEDLSNLDYISWWLIYGGQRFWTPGIFQLDVTLSPGESKGLLSAMTGPAAGDDNLPHVVYHEGMPYLWYFRVFDEIGNFSNLASVGIWAG